MEGRGKVGLALLLAAMLAISLSACGGGSSTGSGTSGGEAPPSQSTAGGESAGGNPGSKSSSPSAEFLTPGGDNSIQTYGGEAGAGEREVASHVLQSYMSARAGEDWPTACGLLEPSAIEGLERVVAAGAGCERTMATIAKRLSPGAWANTMTGPIASLRVKGEHGFALYHGTGGANYFMQMDNAGPVWKVAALEPTAFP